MRRADRLFDIIQVLRRRKLVRAKDLAEKLEVSERTVYRDIRDLMAGGVPIEGEAGVGYVMRAGYDLPPLMFAAEELEAIMVGLALLRRTGDAGLESAASGAADKIASVLPDGLSAPVSLHVSGWNRIPSASVDIGLIRRAVRYEAILRLDYLDLKGDRTVREVKPLALIYYTEALVMAAWCGLRRDFRHFRIDRIGECRESGEHFAGEGRKLRKLWERTMDLP